MTSSTDPTPGGSFPLAGPPVARFGYGALQHGAVGPPPRPARQPARGGGGLPVDGHVTHLDTADFYDHGHVNELIREALASGGALSEDVMIVTKVGAAPSGTTLTPADQPHHLRSSV